MISVTKSVPAGPSIANSEETLWIDQARGVAALAVVVLHLSAGVVRGVHEVTSAAWWIGNMVDSATRWCVPVFVMISGALLLDLQKPMESLSTFYRRRASRLCWPLVFWSCVFLVWNGARNFLKSGQVGYDTLAGALLSGQPHFHLWYLYMLLGLYLFTPFVRALLHQLDGAKTTFLCSLIFLLSCGSALHERVVGGNRGFFLVWFLPYLSYFIAGGIVYRSALSIKTRRVTIVLMCSIALTAIGCYVFAVRSALESGLYFYDYFSVTVVPMAICAFLLLRAAPPVRVFLVLAPLSLGVYLVHPLFIEGLSYLGFREWDFNPLWAIPVKALLVFVLSVCLVQTIHRIPVLRRVV